MKLKINMYNKINLTTVFSFMLFMAVLFVGSKIEAVDKEKSVSPVSSIILKEVVDILSNRFNTQIQVGSIIQLSEQERRNLILRINIQNPSAGVPKSIILKQTLPAKPSDDPNKISDRFARDWSGLEFLSMLKTGAPPVPKFYGGSLEHRFILIEDLGESHLSLVDSLTGDNTKEAEIALLRFMIDLGQLHSSSYGKTEDYFKILKKVNPSAESWQDNLQKAIEKYLPDLKLSLKSLNMVPSENILSEINSVFKSNLAPGPFTTLIHGDICPDNVFYNREKNELYLIDFEYSVVKNALLDGTYLRMSFPTCWCAKSVPDGLISTLEASYREQLKKTIPAARSDEEYHDAYVNACAFWMLKSLLLIEVVLEKEDIWSSGPTPPESLWNPEANLVRPRVLSRLISFIEISKAYKKLPHLLSMAEEVLKELEIRWPDAKPLELYPAFSKSSTGKSHLAKQHVQIVVFDFGGVIAQANTTQMSNFLINSFNINKDELSSALRDMQNYVSKGGSEKQFWEQFAISKRITLPNDWFNQFGIVIQQSITEMPESLTIVKTLQSQGYQTAMLSDVTQYQAEIIRKMGYYDLFTPVLLSYEIGVKKPNPEAFQILLKKLKLPAPSVLFIDDRIENVEAAKNQGIDSIQFINPEQLKDELEKRGFDLSKIKKISIRQ